MQPSDLEGLTRLGAAAHAAGREYWDNPMFFNEAPLEQWVSLCSAWAAGWLEADNGRDKELARLLNRTLL